MMSYSVRSLLCLSASFFFLNCSDDSAARQPQPPHSAPQSDRAFEPSDVLPSTVLPTNNSNVPTSLPREYTRTYPLHLHPNYRSYMNTRRSAPHCREPHFTPDRNVNLRGHSTLLISTHIFRKLHTRLPVLIPGGVPIESKMDMFGVSKPGLDHASAYAKLHSIPIVHIAFKNVWSEDMLYGDCDPTYTVHSGLGGFNFDFDATHVISVGGHFTICHEGSIESILDVWRDNRRFETLPLKITMVTDGIYDNGGLIRGNEPFAQEIRNRLRATEKVNLFDELLIIGSRELQIDYIKESLRRYEGFYPDTHRIDIHFNGNYAFTYRDARRQNPSGTTPILLINYESPQAF